MCPWSQELCLKFTWKCCQVSQDPEWKAQERRWGWWGYDQSLRGHFIHVSHTRSQWFSCMCIIIPRNPSSNPDGLTPVVSVSGGLGCAQNLLFWQVARWWMVFTERRRNRCWWSWGCLSTHLGRITETLTEGKGRSLSSQWGHLVAPVAPPGAQPCWGTLCIPKPQDLVKGRFWFRRHGMESEILYSNKLVGENAGLGIACCGTRLQPPWLADSLLFFSLHHSRVTLFPTLAASHFARGRSAQFSGVGCQYLCQVYWAWGTNLLEWCSQLLGKLLGQGWKWQQPLSQN